MKVNKYALLRVIGLIKTVEQLSPDENSRLLFIEGFIEKKDEDLNQMISIEIEEVIFLVLLGSNYNIEPHKKIQLIIQNIADQVSSHNEKLSACLTLIKDYASELVQQENNGSSDFTSLIDGAGSEYNTLSKIQQKLTQLNIDLINLINGKPYNGITETNISDWNQAFNWGDHAVAGYLTPDSLPSDISTFGPAIINITDVITTLMNGVGDDFNTLKKTQDAIIDIQNDYVSKSKDFIKLPLRVYFIGGPSTGVSLYSSTDISRGLNYYGQLLTQIGNPIIAANLVSGGSNYQSDGLYRINAIHPIHPFIVANQYIDSCFMTDTVISSLDYTGIRKLKTLIEQYSVLADIQSRKPALIVLSDIGWHSVTENDNDIRTWRTTVKSIIDAAAGINAHVLIFPDVWNPSYVSGVMAAFNPSNTKNPDKKEIIKNNNKWLSSLADIYQNVWFFDIGKYAYDTTSTTEYTPKMAALSKSYIYAEKEFTWHLANAAKSDLGEVLKQISTKLGGSPRPFDNTDRAVPIFRDVTGSSENWTTNYGATLSNPGNGPLFVYTDLPATPSAVRFTAGTQSVRRQMASNGITNFNFIGSRISFRTSAWAVPYDYVLNVGPYALRFKTSNNTISLYNLVSWPTSTNFSASNLGTLIGTWTHIFDNAGHGEGFIIRINQDDNVLSNTSAVISIYSNRRSQVVVENFGSGVLNFADYLTNASNTTLGFGCITSGSLFISDVVVSHDKLSGAVDRFDHTLSTAFIAVTNPQNGWSGTFPVDIVHSSAFLPTGTTAGGQNATTTSSRVLGSDGEYKWQWDSVITNTGGTIIKIPLGIQMVPGRFYQAVWPYMITGVSGSPVAPLCGLYLIGPGAGWRTLYAVGIDQDAVGNNSPIFDRGGITDAMDSPLVARSAIYKVTEGNDYGDAVIFICVSSKLAATFTMQCNLPQLHDVTDIIKATSLY